MNWVGFDIGFKVSEPNLVTHLIVHPHLLVRATSERFPPARATFKCVVASESHWLQPVLVLTVRWWPGTSKCGRAINRTPYICVVCD